jgi:hypothetical protein
VEVKFFGSVDAANAAPGVDADKDGSSNWKEYLAGTDPTDPESHLNLRWPEQKLKNGKKHLALRWLSAPGKKYVIETTTDLVNGPWTVLVSGVIGDGRLQEFLGTATGATTQYYRVRLQD